MSKSQENMGNLNTLRPKTLQVIKKGAIAALERGPRVGGQVVETQVRLHNATIGRGIADSFVMAATGQCVQKVGILGRFKKKSKNNFRFRFSLILVLAFWNQ